MTLMDELAAENHPLQKKIFLCNIIKTFAADKT